MNKENFVIIAAGGFGTRMGGDLPKQFMLLQGKPVLMHSMENFHLAHTASQLILVIADEMKNFWQQLCEEHQFTIPHILISAGPTRFQSIKNGLDYILENYSDQVDMISIHDGARPLVSTALIDKSFNACALHETAICALKSVNSIRIGSSQKNQAYDRDQIWSIQTPQVFKAKLLFEAYKQEETKFFTDDASVVEKLGKSIHLIEGDSKNIKITYKEDLAIAQLFLNLKDN